MTRDKSNLAASVRQRLLNRSRATGRLFNELLQYFAMERLVVPGPTWIDYPALLDLPAPRVRGYTRESVIAEKLHVIALRGVLNSRLRDYFDIWALSRQFDFEGDRLASAIRETFACRGLRMPAHLVGLSDEFAADGAKALQWQGFLRRSRLSSAPGKLPEVVHHLRGFLEPVAAAVRDGASLAARWEAPGPWAAQGSDSAANSP